MKAKRGTRNNKTGIVHEITNSKVGLLQLYTTVCEVTTGLVWEVADGEEITCTKCQSKLSYTHK